MRILLLEDEFMLSKSIRTFLLAYGHLVDYYDNGEEVLDVILHKRHDFYILDINTPLVNGLECLKAINSKYPDVPKIIISAYSDIEYISNAFNIGCSDYLKKPFNLKELQIRMQRQVLDEKKVLEKEQKESMISLGKDYIFDKTISILYYKLVPQRFTKREQSLLILFISNLGQVMSDENIKSFIWNGEDVETSTVRSLVNRLRKKLKEDILQNVHGLGYVLNYY